MGLTRQLLAFSRKQVIAPTAVDLNALVRDLHDMLSRLLGADISLRIALAEGVWPVMVDSGQFNQVVVNLVVNARDAMPDGGVIEIETQNVLLEPTEDGTRPVGTPQECVLLSVRDNGQGFSDDAKKHLFEPFFTTKSKDKGTGLGLAMVYGAVKQAEGTIRVDSVAAVGTTVRIYLPRWRNAVPSLSEPPQSTDPMKGTETILLVEDEPAVRKMVVTMLQQLGYRVAQAANGAEALDVIGTSVVPMDLLVTDVVMPGMNGRELVERVWQRWPQMKVLFMSGYTADVMLRHGLTEEAVNVLAKPFTRLELARKIREALTTPAQ